MEISEAQELLCNTYIKNDFGMTRLLYVKLCIMCNLHDTFKAEEYKWPYLFESKLGVIQHAPFRKHIKGKKRITYEELLDIYTSLIEKED